MRGWGLTAAFLTSAASSPQVLPQRLGLNTTMTPSSRSSGSGSLLDEVAGPRRLRDDPDGALIALSERLVTMVLDEDGSGRIERHARQHRHERERAMPSSDAGPR